MEVIATTKYARISPSKAIQVALLLKGKPVNEALTTVELIPRKSARLISKTLHSAVANAENNFNIKRDGLFVKTAEVSPGPIIRRFRSKARGMSGRIRKRTSHFTIVLTDEKQ